MHPGRLAWMPVSAWAQFAKHERTVVGLKGFLFHRLCGYFEPPRPTGAVDEAGNPTESGCRESSRRDRRQTQCAAKPNAARCNSRCSALRSLNTTEIGSSTAAFPFSVLWREYAQVVRWQCAGYNAEMEVASRGQTMSVLRRGRGRCVGRFPVLLVPWQ